MIKAILVDDELNAIKNLTWELESFCDGIEVCDSFTDPVEAISAINYLKPDCVFLDIEMPEMDGFQLLAKLKYREFDLIITTAYDNYAIKAFKENAIDYLLKPIDSDDLIKAVERIKRNKKENGLGFEIQTIVDSLNPNSRSHKTAIPLAGKTLFVETDNIIYAKSSGNYTEIFFSNQKSELLTKKLKDVEELIGYHSFYRVHNSYLVNLNYVKEYVKSDGHYLILKDGKNIPIARSRKTELLQQLRKL